MHRLEIVLELRFPPLFPGLQLRHRELLGHAPRLVLIATLWLKVLGLSGNQQSNNESKQTEHAAKDLNDQNLDKQRRITRVRERSRRARDSDGNTADKVASPDSHTAPEYGVAGVEVASAIQLCALHVCELGRKHNA